MFLRNVVSEKSQFYAKIMMDKFENMALENEKFLPS